MSLMENVILDIDILELSVVDLFELSRDRIMRILEGIDVRRRPLQVRMLGCCDKFFEETTLASFFQGSKTDGTEDFDLVEAMDSRR